MLSRWNSKGDNSEIESKDDFQKHYSAQGSSDWLRCIEESEMTALVKKGEKGRYFILWLPPLHFDPSDATSTIRHNGIFRNGRSIQTIPLPVALNGLSVGLKQSDWTHVGEVGHPFYPSKSVPWMMRQVMPYQVKALPNPTARLHEIALCNLWLVSYSGKGIE